MSDPRKVIMALSGGMDSSTMLAYLLDLGYECKCYNFIYGSKHNKYEMQAAQKIAEYYNVEYNLIDMTTVFEGMKSNLLLSGGEIPEGHYTDKTMSKTVVPGRNSIFACTLMGIAESIGYGKIALGVHQGDHEIYADCRQEYIKALDTMVYLASDRKVEVITPFIDTDKIGICGIGLNLKVPYEYTRTCYKDQAWSCGRCGSCFERLEAFEENGAVDPIEYENRNNNLDNFETLEGVVSAIELLKNKISQTTNVEKILQLSRKINQLEEQKKEFEKANIDVDLEQLNKEKINVENQLVSAVNKISTCKKDKNREILTKQIDRLKKKIISLDNQILAKKGEI